MFVVLKVVITEVTRRAKPSSRRGLPEIKKVEDGGHGSHTQPQTQTQTQAQTQRHTNTLSLTLTHTNADMQTKIRIYSRWPTKGRIEIYFFILKLWYMSAWARFDFRLTYISVTINLQKPNWIFKDDLLTPCARKCLHFHNQALKAILHCERGDITYRENAGRYKYLSFFLWMCRGEGW